MKNLSVIFYSWLSSVILLFLFLLFDPLKEEILFIIFFASIVLAVICTVTLLCLYIIDVVLEHFYVSDKNILLVKVFFTLIFYAPIVIGFLGSGTTLQFYPTLSFLSTVSILIYHERHLLSSINFSHYKNNSIMENEHFSNSTDELEPQEKSTKYIFKGVLLLVMGLILFISTFLVKNIISEREQTKATSQEFFEKSWGPNQTITGPFFTIPYKNAKGDIDYAYLMPKDLVIQNQLDTDLRKKGIFENIVYKNKVKAKGYFSTNDIYELNTGQRLLLDQASFGLGVSQISGLDVVQKFEINKKSFEGKSGLLSEWISSEGLSTNYPIEMNQLIEFDIEFTVKGTEGVNFLPLGQNTRIDIASNWHSPSFQGKYIPNEKPNVSKNGFTASWIIQHFNKTFPQFWIHDKYQPTQDSFGVDLKLPVNNYVKSERTIKYAALVIGLIFLIFFIIEINNQRNIHAVQYLLVGFALCLFYGLLISFSELMNFNLSYIIAAVMTVSLVSVYIYSVLKQVKFGLVTAFSLSGIYTYLYIILQQEDYALLIGSLGLFVILAIIMFFTRKIQFSLN